MSTLQFHRQGFGPFAISKSVRRLDYIYFPAKAQTGKEKLMTVPDFTLRQLLEAGVHYGHQTRRWNPRMSEYIHSKKNGIHIIDLTQTVPLLDAALTAISKIVENGGKLLFVGTKRQAQKPIAAAAERCAQYYINYRWLGGTLTNWNTVSNSISRLNQINEKLAEDVEGLTKKERLGIEREQSKLQSSLGGIREMGGLPDILFVIDVNKEALAIAEANKLSIPVVAVVDTNCSPDGISYIIPGNDDASRAIALYCELAASAALAGMKKQLGQAGVDLGEFAQGLGEDSPVEPILGDAGAEQSDGVNGKSDETAESTNSVENVPGTNSNASTDGPGPVSPQSNGTKDDKTPDRK